MGSDFVLDGKNILEILSKSLFLWKRTSKYFNMSKSVGGDDRSIVSERDKAKFRQLCEIRLGSDALGR